MAFGRKAGYNSSKITGPWENFFNTDIEISPLKYEGAHLGAYLEITVTNKLNFQPEFLITMKDTEVNLITSLYRSVIISDLKN